MRLIDDSRPKGGGDSVADAGNKPTTGVGAPKRIFVPGMRMALSSKGRDELKPLQSLAARLLAAA